GGRLRNAARTQVEQLLVVEPAGGRGVPGPLDLAGLDLQVRHRVGAGTVGEHQVAVQLVGVGALGLLADQHVTDPHAVRLVSLQGALVGDPGDAVRYGVVHEPPVLLVLAGVCEVQSVHLHVPAGGGERGLRGEPDHITTEGDDHVPQSGIPADGGAVAGGVHSTGVPVLHGNHPQVGAVTDVDLHGLGERRIATV